MLKVFIILCLGAISLFLYACVVVAKQADEKIYKQEDNGE